MKIFWGLKIIWGLLTKIFGVGKFLGFANENVPRFLKSGMWHSEYPTLWKFFRVCEWKKIRRLVMKMFAVGKFLGCKNIRVVSIKIFTVGKCFGVC